MVWDAVPMIVEEMIRIAVKVIIVQSKACKSEVISFLADRRKAETHCCRGERAITNVHLSIRILRVCR